VNTIFAASLEDLLLIEEAEKNYFIHLNRILEENRKEGQKLKAEIDRRLKLISQFMILVKEI